ncbi:MAG: Holliday junction resolvase RuvX [Bacteroidetes bacterium]|nr:Holliday junction resolvase RuvX [Bacteroidota bacterium]
MSRILAIDYGTKRVGLAVTDPMKIIATSLATVRAHDIIVYLKNYLQTETIECFVVGKPMKLDGSDSQSAVHVEKFISLLRKNFPEIKIERIDERYTSTIATRAMLEMGLKKKDRQKKENVDQHSSIIHGKVLKELKLTK